MNPPNNKNKMTSIFNSGLLLWLILYKFYYYFFKIIGDSVFKPSVPSTQQWAKFGHLGYITTLISALIFLPFAG